MTHVLDTDLSAYLDGELDTKQTSLLEKILATDTNEMARLQAMRRVSDALPFAYALHANESGSARFDDLLEGRSTEITAPKKEIGTSFLRTVGAWLIRSRPIYAGVGLAAGIAVMFLATSSNTSSIFQSTDDGTLYASADLDSFLTQTKSGNVGYLKETPALVLLSLESGDGPLCRLAQVGYQQILSCHEREDWLIVAFSQVDTSISKTNELVTASGNLSPAMAAHISRLSPQRYFDATAEEKAIRGGWRTQIKP